MDAKNDHGSNISVGEILLVSVFSGLVLGALTLCLYRPMAGLLGDLSFDFAGICRRSVAGGLINLLALAPMIAILRVRCDLISVVLSGPQMALAAFVAGTCIGVFRWGTPPPIAWLLGGCWMIYIMFLGVVAFVIVRKALGVQLSNKPTGGDVQ